MNVNEYKEIITNLAENLIKEMNDLQRNYENYKNLKKINNKSTFKTAMEERVNFLHKQIEESIEDFINGLNRVYSRENWQDSPQNREEVIMYVKAISSFLKIRGDVENFREKISGKVENLEDKEIDTAEKRIVKIRKKKDWAEPENMRGLIKEVTALSELHQRRHENKTNQTSDDQKNVNNNGDDQPGGPQ